MTSKASGSELSRSRISLGFVGLVSFGIVFATSQAHTQQAPAGVRPAIEPTAAQPKKADQGDAPLTPQERAALPLSSGDYGEVERLWKAFLEAQHYREGENPGDVFISSGTAVVNFAKGRSGWIEARRNAFQVAELKSKASMIKFIEQGVSRTRNFSLLENPSFGQGQNEEIRVLTQADRIIQKTVDVTEKILDTTIQALDSGYDPTQYQKQDRRAKELRLQEAMNERIRGQSARSVSGALTYHVIEGPTPSGDGHQILVATIWSPNLGRLAIDIRDGEYAMPTLEARTRVEERLPKTVGEAVASFGTRIIVNEKGQRALLAYGQAEIAGVSPDQRDRARSAALDRAELHARSEIVSFVGECLFAQQEVESRALSRAYEGLAQDGSSIEIKHVLQIRAISPPVSLTGIEKLKGQIVQHPETKQDIAIVAVLWSPVGLEAGKRIGKALEAVRIRDRDLGAGPASKSSVEPAKPLTLERPPGDKEAH